MRSHCPVNFRFNFQTATLFLFPPPLRGRVREGGTPQGWRSWLPPSPTLPRKGERDRARSHRDEKFNFQTATTIHFQKRYCDPLARNDDTLIPDTASRPRGAMRPSCAFIFRPMEGVGNTGCLLHPRPRVHFALIESTRVTTSTPEHPAFPHAMVLTAYVVLSPVTGLFCHRRLAD